MVQTKTKINISIDAKEFTELKQHLDNNLINVSRYFNKLMLDDLKAEKLSKRDKNIKEIAEVYKMSIEDVQILTNLYDLCDFAYDFATKVYEDENIFENFLKSSDFISDAIHVKNKHITEEEYNIMWEHLGDYKD